MRKLTAILFLFLSTILLSYGGIVRIESFSTFGEVVLRDSVICEFTDAELSLPMTQLLTRFKAIDKKNRSLRDKKAIVRLAFAITRHEQYKEYISIKNSSKESIYLRKLMDRLMGGFTYSEGSEFTSAEAMLIGALFAYNKYNAHIPYMQDISRASGSFRYLVETVKDQKLLEYLIAKNAISYINVDPINEDIDAYFKKYVKDPQAIEKYEAYYQLWLPVAIGEKAAPLVATNLNGDTVTLDDFKGKIVVMDFWYAACSACRHQIRTFLPAVHHEFENEDVVFVMANIDKDPENWRRAIEKDKSVGVHIWLPNQKHNEFIKAMHISSYPTYIILDREGRIFNIHAPIPESPQLGEEIRKALKKQ